MVAIQSVSAWPHKRQEIVKVVNWTAEKLRNLGATTDIRQNGNFEHLFSVHTLIVFK